ncbi:DUF2637 domain-containing protein [Actinomadura sp. NEAU-AAG7]|uniref:DUF2637 domain-containing protein n=1 Tax=Actinomadura sp. NEAU-AAG7 TaxID=2839640 RepID=UPI001BE3F518|nr:DUF2637 domain-containing protein [Actinomadura sp. NEAU-AAG7]MBT2207037.1 DUF2637 domain-containing protein [Actinomadura sp. NEAU-AAG7]
MKVSAINASTAATVVAIGAIAAYISYRHALDVATAYGEPGATGRLVPLTIDGLVYVASMVMLDAARRRVQAPALARFALVLGIGATVAVNVLHGVAHGPVGAVIAAWPAITLVVAVELLMGMIRRGRDEGETPSNLDGVSEPLDAPDGYARWDEIDPSRETLPPREATGVLGGPQWDGDEPEPVASGLFELPDDDAPSSNLDEGGVADLDLVPVVASAREWFAEVLASGALPSVRALRRDLRIGHPKAVRVRAALEAESARESVLATS